MPSAEAWLRWPRHRRRSATRPAAIVSRLSLTTWVPLAGILVVGLAGCQTTAERSAALAKRFHRETIDQHGLSIGRPSRYVKVLETALVHDANGTAAAVTVQSSAPGPLRDVPIAITLTSPQGRVLYQNNAPGLDPSLTSAPLLLPRRAFTWVDDQVQASAFPARISARVGEAAPGSFSPATIAVRAAHLEEDPANDETAAHGTVVNRSAVSQEDLVVFAVARRSGQIVAAGRAVLSSVAGHASSPFEVFFIGNPSDARLELTAPATHPS